MHVFYLDKEQYNLGRFLQTEIFGAIGAIFLDKFFPSPTPN